MHFTSTVCANIIFHIAIPIAIWKIIEARYIGYCVQSHLTIKHGFHEIFARQSGTNSILGISFFLMATPVAHGRSWARD